MMYRFQKGQSIVEFALVLPLFLLIVFGIINFGFLFADYVALNDVARSSAREASIAPAEGNQHIQDTYDKIAAKYQNNTKLPVQGIYDWTITIQPDTKTSDEKKAQSSPVLVTIDLKISNANPVFFVFENLVDRGALPESFTIKYYMYREQTS